MAKYAKRQSPVSLICPTCSTTFVRPAWYVRKKQDRNPSGKLYCSHECYRMARWGTSHKVELPCSQCGKPVVRTRAQIDKRSKYGPFCSHGCYGKWRSENLTGEDSPSWKGGYTLDYGGSNWKRQRRRARKRDSYTCQGCGVTEQEWGYKLDVHHIVPYDLFDNPKEASRLDNLVTLCRQCHVKRHNGTHELKQVK